MKAVLAVFGFVLLVPSLVCAGEAATYGEIKIFNKSKEAIITAVGYTCTVGVGLSQYDKRNDGTPLIITAPNEKTKCQGLNMQIKYPAHTEIPVKNYYSETIICKIDNYLQSGFYLQAGAKNPLIIELTDGYSCKAVSN